FLGGKICMASNQLELSFPLFERTPQEIEQNSNKAMADADEALKKIVELEQTPDKLSLTNTFVASELAYGKVEAVASRLEIISNTFAEKEMRDKADEMKQKLSAWGIETSSRDDIYLVFKKFIATKPK